MRDAFTATYKTNNRRKICDVEHCYAFQTMTHLGEPTKVQTDFENSWKSTKNGLAFGVQT